MAELKIKSCPFCGGEAFLKDYIRCCSIKENRQNDKF